MAKSKIQWSKIVKKAHSDPEFKKSLLANPRAAIQAETGVQLPEGVDFVIHEQSANQVHLTLPLSPDEKILNAVFYGGETEGEDPDTEEA
jgi:hypothetical protein